jgi:amino acid transporter
LITKSEKDSHELCPKPPPVFVRDATGLTKQISLFSAFAYNVNSVTIGYAVTAYSLILAFVPGANAMLSFLISMLLSVPLLLVYAIFTASMPRSGGEYVFISRTLHPWLGSLAAFTVWLIEIIYLGINSSWIGSVYMSAPLVLMGEVLNSQALITIGSAVATPLWAFVIGTIVIVGVGVSMISGTGTYLKLQNVIFVIGTIAAIVMIGVLLGATNGQFVTSFNQHLAPYMTNSTNPYNDIQKIAAQQGFTIAPFSWYATLVGSAIASGAIAYSYFSTYAGGEMKRASNVGRQSFVMLGSMVFNTGLAMIIASLIVAVAGSNFAGATFYLGTVAPSSWPFPVSPFLNVFIAMLTDNVVLNAIMAVGWMSWGIATTVIIFLMVSRMLFAWSFDRLIPSFFADVSERFHTPVKAIVTIIVLGEISTLIFLQYAAAYGALIALGNTVSWIATAFLFVSIAAILFPYVAKSSYEASPASKYKVGKIPLISLMGVIAATYQIVQVYFFLTVPSLGALTPGVLSFWGTALLVAALLYPVIYLIRKRQGIDLRMVFAVVPPE